MCNSVENGDNCLHAMTLGKAAGCDSIETEHILAKLLNAMLEHCYVPNNFGLGIIIPLIKDKSGDASNSSITLSTNIYPIVLNVFLGIVWYIPYIRSDLQFGLKNELVAKMLFMPFNLLSISIRNMGLLLTYVKSL